MHKSMLAYRGQIYLSKTHPELLGRRDLGQHFFSNFILGRKDNTGTFMGKLSRFSVWGAAGGDKSLKDAADCSGSPNRMNLGRIYFIYFKF